MARPFPRHSIPRHCPVGRAAERPGVDRRYRKVTKLLRIVREDLDRDELVRQFTQIHGDTAPIE